MATDALAKANWTSMRSPWRGVTWLVGGLAALVAAAIALFLAVVFFIFAVTAAVLLTIRSAFRRPRRPQATDGPTTIDARRVGGHSWVAYGWDGGR